MTARFALHSDDYFTVVCVYAPTLNANESVKENFCIVFDQVIVGDFNDRVGSGYETWSPIGHNRIGKINLNGQLLLSNLIITNTQFQMKN